MPSLGRIVGTLVAAALILLLVGVVKLGVTATLGPPLHWLTHDVLGQEVAGVLGIAFTAILVVVYARMLLRSRRP